MAMSNNNEEKSLIIYTFKKLCNGEQLLATQQYYAQILTHTLVRAHNHIHTHTHTQTHTRKHAHTYSHTHISAQTHKFFADRMWP